MNRKEKGSSAKGRRWRLSKKKMKEPPEVGRLNTNAYLSAIKILKTDVTEIYDVKELLESKEINLKPRVNINKVSKLSPSLLDILKKSVALGYFLEFLKDRDQKQLLDFWLEAETFRMISERKYRRRSSKSSRHGSPFSNVRRQRTASSTSVKTDDLNDSLNNSFSSIPECCSCRDGISSSFTNCTCVASQEHAKTERQNTLVENQNMYLSNHEWDMLDSDEIFKNKTKSESEQLDTKDTVEGTPSINSITTEPAAKNEPLANPTIQVISSSRKAATLPKVSSSSSSIDHFRERARTRSAIIDAVTIYTRFISLNAECPVHLPSPKRQQIEGAICKDKNAIDPDCFVIAQDYVFEKLSQLHEEFLLTSNMITYQLKFLEDKQMKLNDILYNEAIFFYFMEFLDQRGLKGVLEFYMSAENFEEDIQMKIENDEYEFEQSVSDAMHIYERYFSMKCEPQLISDDKLRIVLENNICREDGPQANCFCIPMAYAWTALADVYMAEFLSSEVFESYLSHLRHSLLSPPQPNDDMKSCSSRSSLSIDDNFPLVHSDSKLNLFDDKAIDEFWFKPNHHQQANNRLALGHVNEFGVFNSHMEPQPISKADSDSSVSKLSRKMKNLIRGETPEEKGNSQDVDVKNQETETLAWERARKIIADIQQQTQ